MKTSADTRLSEKALPCSGPASARLVDLGAKISLLRRAKNITQAALASSAGIGVSTLAAMERGSASVQIGYVFAVLEHLAPDPGLELLDWIGGKTFAAAAPAGIGKRAASTARRGSVRR